MEILETSQFILIITYEWQRILHYFTFMTSFMISVNMYEHTMSCSKHLNLRCDNQERTLPFLRLLNTGLVLRTNSFPMYRAE